MTSAVEVRWKELPHILTVLESEECRRYLKEKNAKRQSLFLYRSGMFTSFLGFTCSGFYFGRSLFGKALNRRSSVYLMGGFLISIFSYYQLRLSSKAVLSEINEISYDDPEYLEQEMHLMRTNPEHFFRKHNNNEMKIFKFPYVFEAEIKDMILHCSITALTFIKRSNNELAMKRILQSNEEIEVFLIDQIHKELDKEDVSIDVLLFLAHNPNGSWVWRDWSNSTDGVEYKQAKRSIKDKVESCLVSIIPIQKLSTLDHLLDPEDWKRVFNVFPDSEHAFEISVQSFHTFMKKANTLTSVIKEFTEQTVERFALFSHLQEAMKKELSHVDILEILDSAAFRFLKKIQKHNNPPETEIVSTYLFLSLSELERKKIHFLKSHQIACKDTLEIFQAEKKRADRIREDCQQRCDSDKDRLYQNSQVAIQEIEKDITQVKKSMTDLENLFGFRPHKRINNQDDYKNDNSSHHHHHHHYHYNNDHDGNDDHKQKTEEERKKEFAQDQEDYEHQEYYNNYNCQNSNFDEQKQNGYEDYLMLKRKLNRLEKYKDNELETWQERIRELLERNSYDKFLADRKHSKMKEAAREKYEFSIADLDSALKRNLNSIRTEWSLIKSEI